MFATAWFFHLYVRRPSLRPFADADQCPSLQVTKERHTFTALTQTLHFVAARRTHAALHPPATSWLQYLPLSPLEQMQKIRVEHGAESQTISAAIHPGNHWLPIKMHPPENRNAVFVQNHAGPLA